MSRLRIALIGAGHLGRIHGRLLAEIPQAELVAVVDPSEQARRSIASSVDAQSVASVDQLDAESFDAAIVAAPTFLHESIGVPLLSRGIHCLIEKPLAATVQEATALVEAAEDGGSVLQVGHVERFSPAVHAATPFMENPRYIEASRKGGFHFRCLDVGVVMDLMIHDIDLILNWVDSPVLSVDAVGESLMDEHEDFANARITFENGCIANLTASRISREPERSMFVHCRSVQVAIDFADRKVSIVRPVDTIAAGAFRASRLDQAEKAVLSDRLFDDYLVATDLEVMERNPLQDEQRDFIAAIRQGRSPRVTGQAGRDAVDVADQILRCIHASERATLRVKAA